MKKQSCISLIIGIPIFLSAQLQRPMLSPQSKLEQKVGLTDIKIEYSRPSKNNRLIFGELVPWEEIWRTGANENTKLSTTDPIIFGQDTLKAGTYAIFSVPTPNKWDIIFYNDFSNWGVPETWEEKNVVLRLQAPVSTLDELVESFTISIDRLTTKDADLTFSWDKTRATLHFSVPTANKMQASIDKMIAGPSANDYYAAAEFYFKEKKELNKALEWSSKAVALRPEAYWMLRLKAEIQAGLGDFKGALETGKQVLVAAEKSNNTALIQTMSNLMQQWSNKKK